jgi:hypothetical protein
VKIPLLLEQLLDYFGDGVACLPVRDLQSYVSVAADPLFDLKAFVTHRDRRC